MFPKDNTGSHWPKFSKSNSDGPLDFFTFHRPLALLFGLLCSPQSLNATTHDKTRGRISRDGQLICKIGVLENFHIRLRAIQKDQKSQAWNFCLLITYPWGPKCCYTKAGTTRTRNFGVVMTKSSRYGHTKICAAMPEPLFQLAVKQLGEQSLSLGID